jgi:hypothetical protein
MTNYFKKKNKYPKEIEDVFKTLTINGKYQVIGSGSLEKIEYNSDYDLQEFINDKSNRRKANPLRENVLDKIYNYFKKKFIYCKKNPNYFITDFKCGIGEDGEALRWEYKDIIKGIKDDITFQEALMQKSTIKIDMIVFIEGIATEFSENYYFKIGSTTNYYNEDIELGIEKSLNEYLYMKNYWKVLKRLFSLMLRNKTKNKTKLIKLIDFFNSDVGLMNKCKNEFDILLILLEQKFKKVNIDDIFYNIKKIKQWAYQAGIEFETKLTPGGETKLTPGGETKLTPGGETKLTPGGEEVNFFGTKSLKKLEELIIKVRDNLTNVINEYSYNYLKKNFKNIII